MSCLMPLQVSFLSKSLFTNSAGERPDVLMHSHVDGQVVSLGENFPTDLTILKLPPAGFIVYGLHSLGGHTTAGCVGVGQHGLGMPGLQHGLLLDDGQVGAVVVGDGAVR